MLNQINIKNRIMKSTSASKDKILHFLLKHPNSDAKKATGVAVSLQLRFVRVVPNKKRKTK